VERSAVWNAKPEYRFLPSLWEWVYIRLMTRKKDWTEPQRRMMRRAGRLHGLRLMAALTVLACLRIFVSIENHRWYEENQHVQAHGLVRHLLDAETAQVPEIISSMAPYCRWADPELREAVGEAADTSSRKLHASLALLPVDASHVDFLYNRLLFATPSELPVLRDALERHHSSLTPRLWTELESAKPGDAKLLPSAGALATYAPDDGKWEAVGGKVAQALVSVNAVFLGPWIEALRPVRSKLLAPLSTILQAKHRPETEYTLAADILADYASDDPDKLAELLMVANPKAYLSLFPVAEKRAVQVLPILQAELGKRATFSWNDPPLNPSWTKPDASLESRVESARGILSERFAFCQTPWTSSSPPPPRSANRDTVPCGSVPTLMSRW